MEAISGLYGPGVRASLIARVIVTTVTLLTQADGSAERSVPDLPSGSFRGLVKQLQRVPQRRFSFSHFPFFCVASASLA